VCLKVYNFHKTKYIEQFYGLALVIVLVASAYINMVVVLGNGNRVQLVKAV